MKPFLISLTTLAVYASSTHAATYIEPNISRIVLVKIDQVPLDANTMRWMANYLAEIAQQQAGGGARKLRASAKLLALAGQLEKSLPKITAANLKLKQGNPSKSNTKNTEHQRRRLRGIVEYLAGGEFNSEGKLLARLTKDALAPIAPKKSKLSQFSVPDHLWQKSIADYDKFKRVDAPKVINNDRVKHIEIKPTPKQKLNVATAKPKAPEQPASAE